MDQNEKIQHALDLCDKLDKLETILWDRYCDQFLTLIDQPDMENSSLDDPRNDWPF